MTPCQKLLKQEGTARRIESMQQSSATPSLHLWFLGVAEDCCMLSILLAVPSCFNSFWHGVIPTSYFIFNDFYTCNIRSCVIDIFHTTLQVPPNLDSKVKVVTDQWLDDCLKRGKIIPTDKYLINIIPSSNS